MDNKFKLWFCLAVGLQIFIIAAVFSFNQFGSFLGENVLLKLTAPKDPLSLFQGHYFILDYEISTINISSLDSDSFGGDSFGSGDKVFVGLEKKGDFWQAVSVSKTKPKDENVYMEGKVAFTSGSLSSGSRLIRVNYGIEKYFIPEKDWQRVEDIMRKAATQGTVAVQVSISPFNHKGSVKKIFISGEEFKVDKLLNKTSSGQSYGPELKAKDARIMAALSQTRTVMVYTYSDDGNYDNFSCEQSDQINICRDVAKTGGAITIAKNPATNSNSACAFSTLNNPDTPWFCVDSTGRAGYTIADPGRTGYCLKGKSAVCPRLVGEEGQDVPALRPISPVFDTGAVATTSQATVSENKSDIRSIKVVFPNGGESFCVGGNMVIQWRSEGVKAARASVIRVTPQDNIVSYNLSDYVFAQSRGDDSWDSSVFSWKVGDFIESSDSSTVIKGGNYRIEVDSNDNASQVYDVSDKTFVISECR